MANEMNKAFENVVETNVETGAEKSAEIRAEELENVAGGVMPPWYAPTTKR